MSPLKPNTFFVFTANFPYGTGRELIVSDIKIAEQQLKKIKVIVYSPVRHKRKADEFIEIVFRKEGKCPYFNGIQYGFF